MLAGVRENEVLAEVKSRLASGPFAHSSGRKLGLVVEGGGMRGAYSAGGLLALDLLQGNQLFDAAYATSAGVVNCAHFLAGNAGSKAGTYYRELSSKKFLNPLRLHKIVDVDYAINEVMRHRIPLDMDGFLRSRTPLKAAVSNFDTGKSEMLSIHDSPGDAWTIIKASIAMPVFYNRLVPIGSSRYFDAGIAIPFPIMQAIEDGCQDLLVFLSRDPGVALTSSPARRLIYSLLFAKGRKDLLATFDEWPVLTTSLQRRSIGQESTGVSDLRIATIFPSPQFVDTRTTDNGLLREATLGMARETLGHLGHDSKLLEDLIEHGAL